MGYQRYSGDPRWIAARFTSCGCAGTEAGKFEAAAFDDANNSCL